MAISPPSPTLGLNRAIFESRDLLTDLQEQLATGRKVKTYGDIGVGRNQVLSMRSELSQISSYQSTIEQTDVRLDVMLLSLNRLRELASETKSDALEAGFELQASGQTVYQIEVGARFDEVVGLLNTNIGDRHLFSGREAETRPVLPSSEILNGTGTKIGFKQIVSERRQADLGADGLGRLVLTGPEASVTGSVVGTPGNIGGVASAQVTIDIGGTPQNFDISDGGLDTLAALEAAIDTAFGANVATIVGGNQLQLTATNATDTITITDIDAGAAALAGLTTGATTNPTATATIAEDVAGTPFGFKLSAVTSTLTGTNVTGPSGSPKSVSVQFTTTLPQDGETIRLTFDLPDGTTNETTLTARSAAPLADGEFLIGADLNATAANFDTVLTTAITAEAQRSLSAASLFEATDNFFDFDAANPPQRVNGPPFNTATSLVNGTTANTIFWYQGEVSTTSARSSVLAKVDDNIITGYGARANEDAMRATMKFFAAMSVETFTQGDVNASERYHQMQLRTNTGLSFAGGAQSLDDVLTEVGAAKTTIGRAEERHKATGVLLEGFVFDEENTDVFEVSASILALQGRLEASLAVSASLGRLSLVNFL